MFYPFNVIRGILVGLQDDPPCLDLASIRPFLLKGLGLLQREFKAETMETLILDISFNLREDHGIDPAIAALRTGLEVLPHSHKIASDFIMDLWRVAVDNESDEALDEIARRGPAIDLQQIKCSAVPVLTYLIFASLHYQGMSDQADTYYHKAVAPHLTEGVLKERVEKMRNGMKLSLA